MRLQFCPTPARASASASRVMTPCSSAVADAMAPSMRAIEALVGLRVYLAHAAGLGAFLAAFAFLAFLAFLAAFASASAFASKTARAWARRAATLARQIRVPSARCGLEESAQRRKGSGGQVVAGHGVLRVVRRGVVPSL
jgi:hypothetical protein